MFFLLTILNSWRRPPLQNFSTYWAFYFVIHTCSLIRWSWVCNPILQKFSTSSSAAFPFLVLNTSLWFSFSVKHSVLFLITFWDSSFVILEKYGCWMVFMIFFPSLLFYGSSIKFPFSSRLFHYTKCIFTITTMARHVAKRSEDSSNPSWPGHRPGKVAATHQ